MATLSHEMFSLLVTSASFDRNYRCCITRKYSNLRISTIISWSAHKASYITLCTYKPTANRLLPQATKMSPKKSDQRSAPRPRALHWLKKAAERFQGVRRSVRQVFAPKAVPQTSPLQSHNVTSSESEDFQALEDSTVLGSLPEAQVVLIGKCASLSSTSSRDGSDSSTVAKLHPLPNHKFRLEFSASEGITHIALHEIVTKSPAEDFQDIRPDSTIDMRFNTLTPESESSDNMSSNSSTKRKLRDSNGQIKAKLSNFHLPESPDVPAHSPHAPVDSAEASTSTSVPVPIAIEQEHNDGQDEIVNGNLSDISSVAIQDNIEEGGQNKICENAEEGDDNNAEDSDEGDDDGDGDRCNFKAIEAIPDLYLQLLAQQALGLQSESDARVTGRIRGAYNFVAFIEVNDDGDITEYVIRIPGHGTKAHWMAEDGYMLEREVNTINMIRDKTSAPVPSIIAYSDSCYNSLGFPYIMMDKLPGNPAWSIWLDQPYDPAASAYAYRTADEPSVGTEKKRLTFLRSLARIMTEVESISFDKIGMFVTSSCSNESYIGPFYHWKGDGTDHARSREPAASIQEYIQTQLKKFQPNPSAEVNEKSIKWEGVWHILNIIFSLPVFNPPKRETFTFHHNDLDLQNILVDEDGNVTGIIDWDGSTVAPRCVAAAAVPIFLRNDWFPCYMHDIRMIPHMAWNYHHYREVYAAAMVEAGSTDAKYTLKSAIYHSAIAAITEGGDAHDLISKLLRQIPYCLVDPDDFKLAMGCGWDAGVAKLQLELPKIFEPELPRSGLLQDIEADSAAREWMMGLDKYAATDDEDAGADSEDDSGVDAA